MVVVAVPGVSLVTGVSDAVPGGGPLRVSLMSDRVPARGERGVVFGGLLDDTCVESPVEPADPVVSA